MEFLTLLDPAALVNGGALILVIWLVIHTFKHTIPRLVDDFKVAIKEQRNSFVEELREERKMFREELGAQRDELAKLTSELHNLRDDLRAQR
jgi:hypothetical protein